VPSNPSRVVTSPLNEVENIAASAGLKFTSFSSKDKISALDNLQNELDLAHLPIVYHNGWTLAVGYDSERNQLFLQQAGARFETVMVKDFSLTWQKAAPGGGSFTLLSFHAPGERATDKPTPRVISAVGETVPTPRPTPPLASGPGNTPSTIFQLKPLSTRDAHRRALRSAASLMRRPGSDTILLNIEALDAIAGELARLAVRPASPVPIPEDAANPVEQNPETLPEDQPAVANPTAPPVTRNEPPSNALARARALLGWFGTPLQHWINERRAAAAYLDSAADSLDNAALQRAAGDFHASISALQGAADVLPRADGLSDDGKTLSDDARRRLETAAHAVAAARDAERRAATAMSRAG
jgi:hypothetical protein